MIRILICLLMLTSSSWATTWYVRDGGADYGTDATHCDGQTNVVYTTNGGPHCAVDHPAWILGVGGYSGGTNPSKLSSGDTLYIDGDSDVNPGQQAQYMIGYGMPNSSGICNAGATYNCYVLSPPAGSSGAPTSIIGMGTHKPQFWDYGQAYQDLSISGDYITLQWLEFTDHQAAAYNDPVDACPTPDAETDGLEISGSHLILTDIYSHGNCRYGINVPDSVSSMGDVTFTRVWSIGNGYGGIISGTANSLTGTWTFNQPIVEWNGCVEAYPLTGGIDNPANYSNCFGQDSGGYGDGLAFGNDTSGNVGNWTIIGPGSMSFNTQDGLDTLHGSGNGTVQVDKIRFEGNGGNQVKINAQTGTVTNSIVISDCGWWYGASQTVSGGMGAGGDGSCRAVGNAISYFTASGAGNTDTFYNNTILSNGDVVFDQNGSCDSSDTLNIKNNIIVGGYSWIYDTAFNSSGDNRVAAYNYVPGCSTMVINEDYNLVTGTRNSNSGCNGSHDLCGTSPSFTGTIPMGTSGGGANTYYQGQQAVTLVPISSTSAAKGAGVSGLTYWNTENDYYNVVRPSIPSMGALEVSSCAASGYLCFYNSDCCSNNCSNNVCSGNGSAFSLSGKYSLSGKFSL